MRQLRGPGRVAAGVILCGLSGAVALADLLGGAGAAAVVFVGGLAAGTVLLAAGWASAGPAEPHADDQAGDSDVDALVQAAATDLGGYVRAYSGNWSVGRDRAHEAVPIIGILVVLACPLAAFGAVARTVVWLAVVALATGSAGFLFVRWDLRRNRVRQIHRYEEGFVCRGVRQVHAFHWGDVAEVRKIFVPLMHQGRKVGTRTDYHLRARDGRQATFTGDFGPVLAARVPSPAAEPNQTTGRAGPQVPPQVAREAARLGLGKLQTPSSLRPHGGLCRLTLLASVMVTAGLAGLASGGALIVAAVAAVAATTFFLLYGGVPALRQAQARRGWSIRYLYVGGLVVTGWRGQVRLAASWRELPGLYERPAFQVPGPRRQTRRPATQHYLLVPRPGRPPAGIILAAKPVPEVLAVRARVTRAALSARLLGGERLRFGPFLLSREGLAAGAQTVPWPDVAGCEVLAGVISVSLEGSPQTLRARAWHVPDAEAFTSIVRSRAGRDWATIPAPAPSAPPAPADAHTVGTGRRDRLLGFLSPVTISRLAVTVGGGAGIVVGGLTGHALQATSAAVESVAIATWAGSAALLAAGVTALALWAVVPCFACPPRPGRPASAGPRPRWLPPGLPRSPRRLTALAAVAAGLGTVLGLAGPGPVLTAVSDAVLTILPAAFVLLMAVWAFALTQRRVLASRHRLLRHGADLLAAVPAGLAVLVLISPSLLVDQRAAGVLFPLGAWCAVRTWMLATRSRRLAVRAGADIALSLLLGADLVLLLVWLANLLGMREGELAGLRRVLQQIGSVSDLPWWLWAGVYVVLASASLAVARWPVRLGGVSRWSRRLHLVPAVDAGRRTLTVLHIGLLAIVLVALATPPSLGAALRGPLKTRYTVALQRELIPDGELAAYTQIRREFSDGHVPAAKVASLRQVVAQIHAISPPAHGETNATGTEDELAYELGLMQASTVLNSPPPPLTQTEAEVTGPDAPISDVTELRSRMATVTSEQEHSLVASRDADQAADLAAAAVAELIGVPHLGDTEVVQIVREYLGGLIEGSRVKEVFAAWADRLAGHPAPPAAEPLVVPDGTELKQVAAAAYAQEQTRTGKTIAGHADSSAESAAALAVDLTNRTRLLAAGNGVCADCKPVSSGSSGEADGTKTPPEMKIKIDIPGFSGTIEVPLTLPTYDFSDPGEPDVPGYTAPAEPDEPEPVEPVEPDPVEPPHDFDP